MLEIPKALNKSFVKFNFLSFLKNFLLLKAFSENVLFFEVEATFQKIALKIARKRFWNYQHGETSLKMTLLCKL